MSVNSRQLYWIMIQIKIWKYRFMKKWCILAVVSNSGRVATASIFVVLFAIGGDNFADHSRHECTLGL